MLFPILIGTVLVGLTILGFQFQSLVRHEVAYAIALIVAILIYIGFFLQSEGFSLVSGHLS